ncbi:MAG TPA: twin-arginine translocase TatA/TatE family subunit [Actinomycetota bacterium]|jgi:sec-independent protein translocase protein TatB|nr:twin-arginine translocase TatA/TatE family subunit [Actinomycetota bacterium]
MPEVGPLEIMMVALVALIVFGPDKLPEMARKVGRALSDFRRVVDDAKGEFQSGFNFDDDDLDAHPMKEVLAESSEDSKDPLYNEIATADTQKADPTSNEDSVATTIPAGHSPSLTPIPMTLDHGSSGEEPDKT